MGSQLKIMRLQLAAQEQMEKVAAALNVARESDASAFSAINHCAKRYMYNNLQWCDTLSTSVIPELRSEHPQDVTKGIQNLEQVISYMHADNTKGFDKCKSVIALKQMASGTYEAVKESVEIRKYAKQMWHDIPNMTIELDDNVPEWLMLPLLPLAIIMDNATHNATTHGKPAGNLSLKITCREDRLLINLENAAGKRHKEALEMQSRHGENALLRNDVGDLDLASIGSGQSTFLGRGEMQNAAAAMATDTTLSLVFHPTTVSFTVDTKMIPGVAPESSVSTGSLKLRENTVLICADDDYAPRASYSGLAKKLKVEPARVKVYGATYAEAAALPSTVLEAAAVHGAENVVCIFDQHMDSYPSGKVLGTDVLRELRNGGFKGLVFIRSANDDVESVSLYRGAGANGCLSKSSKISELAAEVVKQCELGWQMEVCT